ncbi:AdoMet-MTase [Shewanella sp. phage 1/41]|uniref:DNA methyltransferase n=1 Tax=Shewanella sp. phage 1/41 TaxID=1458861 RepID=UPI0004F706DB|nr:DNA methyltransferase [Shewanella sp. phage 1/41]AHK11677.1 AdoMet-MTase [Shewanella sp. phage 1/41]
MKYMGSKARIAKYILPIILKNRKEGQWYVEPFVGGANMIDKVDGNRIGADSNTAVIDALQFIRDCSTPKNNSEYSELDYMRDAKLARSNCSISGLSSYALIAFSFGAKWIGGWSRGKNSKGDRRDYVTEQHKASEKQKPLLQSVNFIGCGYSDLEIPPQSIIYCDPPYAGTTKYKDDFNHDEFWQWCRDKVKEGHQVFISEYNAPDDFECIWSKDIQSGLNTNSTKKGVEKLFVFNPSYQMK